MSEWQVLCGDSAELLKQFPDQTFDALVTDCPSGIGFMGRDWDKDKGGRDKWIAWLAGILAECRRVMKPGAYGWVWALPRTQHWTATACEDAGFTVRDVLDEAFSGDELLDVFLESLRDDQRHLFARLLEAVAPSRLSYCFGTGFPKSRALLKPAVEQWILIKAPGELRELRIEENRIGSESTARQNRAEMGYGGGNLAESYSTGGSGRWPANLAFRHSEKCGLVGTQKIKGDNRPPQDGKRESGFVAVGSAGGDGKPCGPLYGDSVAEEWRCDATCPVRMLDEQSGFSTSPGKTGRGAGGQKGAYSPIGSQGTVTCPSDSGGASRFFYTAKPSTRERSAGIPPMANIDGWRSVTPDVYDAVGWFESLAHLLSGFEQKLRLRENRNTHTTVKSIALMRHLVRLIAAPGSLVLDPFAGSATTGVAAIKEDCHFLGIEQSEEYCEIGRHRLAHAAGGEDV